ncbi:hypothetical protein Q7C36_001255 [Tachysurus vachellii]|uniref:Uncharacterized protein n=1 Tax=Tachysurus vachellii TaxID=175792 RepID=A0AA88P2C6_TACVA|nr:hypothetical protein Q7C36_001255 [Tachysurus vachellii]
MIGYPGCFFQSIASHSAENAVGGINRNADLETANLRERSVVERKRLDLITVTSQSSLSEQKRLQFRKPHKQQN